MIAAATLVLTLALQPAAPPAPEHVAAIRVHGNHTTPDDEVLRLAGVELAQEVTPTLVDEVTARLERSGRFRGVDVRKRYASLSDLSAVLLVIGLLLLYAGIRALIRRSIIGGLTLTFLGLVVMSWLIA